MASVMEEASSFWCHACSRLHQTRAGEAVAACPVCAAAPSASLESIVDFVDARTFLDGCHSAGRPASAHTEPLPLIMVRDAWLTCIICLDELESGASAAETPCLPPGLPRAVARGQRHLPGLPCQVRARG